LPLANKCDAVLLLQFPRIVFLKWSGRANIAGDDILFDPLKRMRFPLIKMFVLMH